MHPNRTEGELLRRGVIFLCCSLFYWRNRTGQTAHPARVCDGHDSMSHYLRRHRRLISHSVHTTELILCYTLLFHYTWDGGSSCARACRHVNKTYYWTMSNEQRGRPRALSPVISVYCSYILRVLLHCDNDFRISMCMLFLFNECY